jgi:hypothetical protein
MPFDSKKLFHWKNDQELWEYGPWLLTQQGIAHVRVLHFENRHDQRHI